MTNIAIFNKRSRQFQYQSETSSKHNQPYSKTVQLKPLTIHQTSSNTKHLLPESEKQLKVQSSQSKIKKPNELSLVPEKNFCKQRLYSRITKQRNLEKLTIINRVKSEAGIEQDFPFLQKKKMSLNGDLFQYSKKHYGTTQNQQPNFHKYLLSKINKKSKYQYLRNKSNKRLAKKMLNQNQNEHDQSQEKLHNFTISIVKYQKSPNKYFNCLNPDQKVSIVEQNKQKVKKLYKNFSFINSDSKKSLISQFEINHNNQLKEKSQAFHQQIFQKGRQQIKKYLIKKQLEKQKKKIQKEQKASKIQKTQEKEKIKIKTKFPYKIGKLVSLQTLVPQIVHQSELDLIDKLQIDVEGWQDTRPDQYTELSEYLNINIKKYTQ